MLKEERFTKIVDYVNEMKYASLEELMKLTSSSESTIRADLVELSRSKKIIRLRGGAQALDTRSSSYEMNMKEKTKLESSSKKKIGEYASSLVNPKSLIYVDAGTTTYHFAKNLTAKEVIVVTNSNQIGEYLTEKGFEVYVTGGKIKLTTDAYIGSYTVDAISKFIFDQGFFGTNGIDLKQGLTTPDYEEAIVKKTAIEHCKEVYILADHTKFDTKSAVSFSSLDKVKIITDSIPDKKYQSDNIKEV
jgi:DeoR family fructose operon transcriptional repressor